MVNNFLIVFRGGEEQPSQSRQSQSDLFDSNLDTLYSVVLQVNVKEYTKRSVFQKIELDEAQINLIYRDYLVRQSSPTTQTIQWKNLGKFYSGSVSRMCMFTRLLNKNKRNVFGLVHFFVNKITWHEYIRKQYNYRHICQANKILNGFFLTLRMLISILSYN